MSARIEPLTAEHVAILASRVRVFDEETVRDVMGLSAADFLNQGLSDSVYSWAGLIDERPVCAFGLNAKSFLSPQGVPWFIATPELLRHRVTFMRYSRAAVAMMLERFPQLVAQCQDNFAASRAWLRRLGFTEQPGGAFAISRGGASVSFVTFKLERA